MTFSAEYRDRAGARNQRDEERFWISDNDDDDREEDMEETLSLLRIFVPTRLRGETQHNLSGSRAKIRLEKP